MATRENETMATWKAVSLAALVFIGALALAGLGLRWLYPHGEATSHLTWPGEAVTGPSQLYDPSHPVSRVTYQTAQFAPSGPAVRLDDRDMKEVGVTREGYLMYAPLTNKTVQNPTWPVGGGGGAQEAGPNAAGAPPGVPGATGPVYLRTVDGLYMPLVQK